jgi:hypothetical protein
MDSLLHRRSWGHSASNIASELPVDVGCVPMLLLLAARLPALFGEDDVRCPARWGGTRNSAVYRLVRRGVPNFCSLHRLTSNAYKAHEGSPFYVAYLRATGFDFSFDRACTET